MPGKEIIRLSANPQGFGSEPDLLEQDMFASELPTQHSHEYFEDPDLGLYVGVWDTDDMVETAGPYEMDEFMLVLEGEARIKNNKTGKIQTVKTGEAFVIPKGYDCQWHQHGYLRKFFMISENPNEGIPEHPSIESIAIPKADTATGPASENLPFLMKEPIKQSSFDCYIDTTGKFRAGTWKCDAFEAEISAFPSNQLSCVVDGSITLHDANGLSQQFDKGDVFFIPAGTLCGGSSDNGVCLLYSILKVN